MSRLCFSIKDASRDALDYKPKCMANEAVNRPHGNEEKIGIKTVPNPQW